MKTLVAFLIVFSLFGVSEAFACADPGDYDTGLGCCTGEQPDGNGLCPLFGRGGGGTICYIEDNNPPCPIGTVEEFDTTGTCPSGIVCVEPPPPPPGGGTGPANCCDSNLQCGNDGSGVCVTNNFMGATDVQNCQFQGYSGACFYCPNGLVPQFDDATGGYTCEYGPNPLCIDYLVYPTGHPRAGECVYDGSCRGDGHFYMAGAPGSGGLGTVCCGDASLDPLVPGIIETLPVGNQPYRPQNPACSWHGEATAGTHQCSGGAGLSVPYWRDACPTNTNSQQTGLRDTTRPVTINLQSGVAPPTSYSYSYPQQNLISNSNWPWCATLSPSPLNPDDLECPEGYEQFQNLTEYTASCDLSNYGDGLGNVNYWGIGCRKETVAAQKPTAEPYTAYGPSDKTSICNAFNSNWFYSLSNPDGLPMNPTCQSGYQPDGQTIFGVFYPTYTTDRYVQVQCLWGIMAGGPSDTGQQFTLVNVTADIKKTTCTPIPNPPPCGNGVCAFDENPTSCPADCTRTEYQRIADCTAPYMWNAAQGRCVIPQCGQVVGTFQTQGLSCGLLTAPAVGGFHCSQGIANQLPEPGFCCPAGQYYDSDAGICLPTNQCNRPLACPDSSALWQELKSTPIVQWDQTLWENTRSYLANPQCLGIVAGATRTGWAACDIVPGKHGNPTYYDVTNLTGDPANVRVY